MLFIEARDKLGVGIVLVILVIIGAIVFLRPKPEVFVYAPVEITGSTLTADDQPSDDSVQVDAEVKQAGFVTVHEAMGDAPGPVVGQSALLQPGSYPDLAVNMSGSLTTPGGYFVLLFTDDGDGIYEPGVDLPVKSNGTVVKVHVGL